MADDKTVTVTARNGAIALYGDAQKPSLKHVHATSPQSPLVHMVCWDESHPCKVEVSGKVELTGSEKHPVQVKMSHHFTNTHHQAVKMETKLADPIHHALQLRTPLQVQFCYPWHITSNYVVGIKLGRTEIISISLTGATIASPQPCAEDKPCPQPVAKMPLHT
jgi:hypothetical protein